jgi:hypothetical protein
MWQRLLLKDFGKHVEKGNIVPVTPADITNAVESGENVGFCRHCGKMAYEIEPDAYKHKCEVCGRMEVYGIERWFDYV